MKKLYSILFFAFLYIKLSAQVCTPNTSCLAAGTSYGFCPDTITNLPPAYLNTPYTTTISFKVPANGADWGFPLVTVSKVEIYKQGTTGTYADGFINLPPGLSYQCSGTSGKCEWAGGSNGCVNIVGTPTSLGLYRVRVVVKAYALGNALTLLDTAYGYKIEVLPESAGLNNISSNKFDVAQNVPNPTNGETVIAFNTLKAGNVSFKLFDLLGKEVYSTNIKARSGYNEIKFDVRDHHLKSGLYFYSINNGSETLTRRLIVKD